MINIEDLTIKEAREIANLFVNNNRPWKAYDDDSHWQIGKNYFIRTVTMIQTGVLVKVTDKDFVLEKAAWIADTGRFTEALATGNFAEVEMFPSSGQVIINRGSYVDACVISTIPVSQK